MDFKDTNNWKWKLSQKETQVCSNPSDHMVTHNHLQWDLLPSSGLSEDSDSVLTLKKKNVCHHM